MRQLPPVARERVEAQAMSVLGLAVVRHGCASKVPCNDPDYAEAYGMLRGVCTYLKSGNVGRDAHEWMDRLKEKFIAVTQTDAEGDHE